MNSYPLSRSLSLNSLYLTIHFADSGEQIIDGKDFRVGPSQIITRNS